MWRVLWELNPERSRASALLLARPLLYLSRVDQYCLTELRTSGNLTEPDLLGMQVLSRQLLMLGSYITELLSVVCVLESTFLNRSARQSGHLRVPGLKLLRACLRTMVPTLLTNPLAHFKARSASPWDTMSVASYTTLCLFFLMPSRTITSSAMSLPSVACRNLTTATCPSARWSVSPVEHQSPSRLQHRVV